MANDKTIYGSGYDKSAFTVRQPKLKIWHMALIGLLIAAALATSFHFGSGMVQFMVIGLVSVGIVGLLYILQNTGFDDRTATEFQCLVFSGAMRSNTALTLILYRDGSIFYMDPRYLKTFEKANTQHNMDQFLSTIGLESGDKIHVYDAIKDLKKAEFEYTYKDGSKIVPLKIGVYPIQRPEGFINLSIMEKR